MILDPNNTPGKRKPPTEKQLAALRAHQYKPGETGNPSGSHGPGKTVTGILRRMLDRRASILGIKDLPPELQKKKICTLVAVKVLQESLEGNIGFLQELLNRTEGKVADRIAGHDGGPLPGPSLNQQQINAILADPQAAIHLRQFADRIHMLAGESIDAEPQESADGNPE